MNYKISTITISYNQKSFLKECIESVKNQSYKNFEHIIVDAGSIDGSRELILEYKNNFSNIIFESDNGPAEGLIKGFNKATGDIFHFLNSDDKLLPNTFYYVNQYFNINNKTDVLFGSGFIIDDNGKIVKRIIVDKYSLRRFAYGNFTFIQPAVFFRKEAYISVKGLNSENKICWDGELFLDFGIKGLRINKSNTYLASFRLYNQSRSGSNTKQNEYNIERNRMFKKVYYRDFLWRDYLLRQLFRLEALLTNPRKLLSKIIK